MFIYLTVAAWCYEIVRNVFLMFFHVNCQSGNELY